MPNILKDLNGGPSRVEFELDEAECAAIGRVTAHWAYLEHAVYFATLELADRFGMPAPEDAKRSSFTRRLGALTQMSRKIPDDDERKRLERLVSRIANAEQDRHKMTHGIWDWDHADPERLSASSFRPGYEFEKRYDTAALHNLASRIGEISFALQYPEGWDEAFKQMLADATDEHGNTAFASVSRTFVRQLLSMRSEKEGK